MLSCLHQGVAGRGVGSPVCCCKAIPPVQAACLLQGPPGWRRQVDLLVLTCFTGPVQPVLSWQLPSPLLCSGWCMTHQFAGAGQWQHWEEGVGEGAGRGVSKRCSLFSPGGCTCRPSAQATSSPVGRCAKQVQAMLTCQPHRVQLTQSLCSVSASCAVF